MSDKVETAAMLQAARQMDWQQVVLNGGPPCFYLESEWFCGRAERWQGHGDMHGFVSLATLLAAAEQRGREAEREACAKLVRGEHTDYGDCHSDTCEYTCGARNHLAERIRARGNDNGIVREKGTAS
jgi:hypothetical protein